MTCSECSTWDDSMKGAYICPKCGSPEMVKAANEPMADIDFWVQLAIQDMEFGKQVIDLFKKHMGLEDK